MVSVSRRKFIVTNHDNQSTDLLQDIFYVKEIPLIKLNIHTLTGVLATDILLYHLLTYMKHIDIRNMNLSLYKCYFHRKDQDLILSLKIIVAIIPSSEYFVISYT
jgi:hypothetical protein